MARPVPWQLWAANKHGYAIGTPEAVGYVRPWRSGTATIVLSSNFHSPQLPSRDGCAFSCKNPRGSSFHPLVLNTMALGSWMPGSVFFDPLERDSHDGPISSLSSLKRLEIGVKGVNLDYEQRFSIFLGFLYGIFKSTLMPLARGKLYYLPLLCGSFC